MGVPLDDFGVSPESLMGADVLHISLPSFPHGHRHPLPRRLELLQWAKTGDIISLRTITTANSGFRSHPMPARWLLWTTGPGHLHEHLLPVPGPGPAGGVHGPAGGPDGEIPGESGLYGCTVSSFEQYTLARFLSEGYFEKHINRMRKSYRTRRTEIRAILENCPGRFAILEQEADCIFSCGWKRP